MKKVRFVLFWITLVLFVFSIPSCTAGFLMDVWTAEHSWDITTGARLMVTSLFVMFFSAIVFLIIVYQD